MQGKRTIISWFMLLLLSLIAVTQAEGQTVFNPSQHDVDSVLECLDEAISNKSQFQLRRKSQLQKIEKQLEDAEGEKKIEILRQLISENMNFSGMAALHWIGELKTIPELKTDYNLMAWTREKEAQVYATMGLMHRALSITDSLDITKMDQSTRNEYNQTILRIYTWADATFGREYSLSSHDRICQENAQKEVNLYETDTLTVIFNKATQMLRSGNYNKGIDILRPLYNTLEGQDKTYFYAMLAEFYLNAHDTIRAEYSLAMTSIMDMEHGNTDYMCLPILVQLLYKQGHVERAYHYLMCCLDDTHLYPACFLTGQTNNIFPIVNREHEIIQEHKAEGRRKFLTSISITVIAIFIIAFGFVYIMHRQQMLKELTKKNEQLQKANETRNIFMKNVTHELHTPLNAVSGFSQILASPDMDVDADSRLEMSKTIVDSCRQLTDLLDNIIYLTDYDSTNSEDIVLTHVKVSEIMDDITTAVSVPIEKPIEVSVHNLLNDDVYVRTNKKMLEQALKILFDNSVKFTDKGSIDITAQTDDTGALIFSVTDTGKGIPDGMEDAIFERFQKLNDFLPGTGLSLALCRTIVNLIDGSVFVDRAYTDPGTRIVIKI